MTTFVNDVDSALARRLRLERERRGWSLAELSSRSGVSKAMISKIERNEASPTAALLGKLSAAFGLTLSVLLERAENSGGRLRRAEQQAVWIDPDTGYRRRQISPPAYSPVELVEVTLPPGARVPMPAGSYAFIRQLIWVREGVLTFYEGIESYALAAGDCLALGGPQDCVFANENRAACLYVVALARL